MSEVVKAPRKQEPFRRAIVHACSHRKTFHRLSFGARVCAVVMASVLTGSCGSLGPVRGISPALQASDVQQASSNVEGIIYALATDAGLYRGTAAAPEPPWYLVAEAGFNYVDDRCSEYFYSLFRLNRRREAVKSGLSAFGQTSAAVLGVTGATTLTMTVVAQAFGLATAMTDVVSGTYLYQLPPATTQAFVKKLQRGYREAAYRKRASIRTPTNAYRTIQDYLALCLPPTIEAQIVERIDRSSGAPDNRDGSIGVRAVSDAEYARTPIVSVTQRVRPAPPPKPPSCSPTRYEQGLTPSRIRAIQRALCINDNGVLDDRLRKAAYEFFKGYDDVSRPGILNCGIGYGHSTIIDEAVRKTGNDSGNVTCASWGYTDAYHVGKQTRAENRKND